MARALTAPELVHLRKDGQHALLYAAVHIPASVYTARLNGIPSGNDKVHQITYDGGAGTPAEAIAGMTVYVGSVAGACDVGKVRLRATLSAAAGTMKIGETSAIKWTDNDYLTVVDEFGLWPRHLRIASDGTVYMDYEVAYSDQHDDCDPVPVLGSDAAVWLTGATVDVEFDGSDSWVPGSTIASYAWLAPGASATSGLATATPTLTYDTAAGHVPYRVSCEVTATNGKTFTGYRYVFVFDDANPPATVFQLSNCTVEWDRGGCSFGITMWDEATRVELIERARVILFARDWYGSTEISIGPLADRENIVAMGWVENESIDWHPEQGSLSFTVQGPQFWFGKMTGFPSGVEDYDGAPANWLQFEDLTVDKGLWHFLHWRTTASACMDWTLTSDSRQISVFDAPPGSLWQQITNESQRTILAHPCCDRYGRLFVQIDSQFLPVADRAAIPVVHTILKEDWRDTINLARITISPVSLLDISGVAYLDDAATAHFALSPGRVYKRYGTPERIDRMVLTDQAQINTLAGLVLGNRNNEYPNIVVGLASNHRMFDVCPHQYGQISITATDTERGITLTDQKIVPRRVSFLHDARTGVFLTGVDFEAYTTADSGITGDPPPEPPSPPVVTPPLPPVPPEPEPVVSAGSGILDQDQFAVSFNIFSTETTVWYPFDPNGDLSGVFQSFAVTGDLKAYVTTRDDGNPNTTGLFYCADISLAVGGTIAWTLLKSATDAENETGYAAGRACFGSVAVNDANQVCALIHSVGNSAPSGIGSGAYIGSGATVTISLLGFVAAFGGEEFYQEQPAASTLHSVFGVPGSWYIAGKVYQAPNNKAMLIAGPAWAYTDFYTVPGEAKMVATGGATGGYVVGHSDQVYENWDAGSAVAGLTVKRALGIAEDDGGTHRLYVGDDADFDLYEDEVLIGDASSAVSGFGVAAWGSMGAYRRGGAEIVWLLGDAQSFASHRVVIYSDDGGVTWVNKTGNLKAALGDPADWSGWTDAATGNAIVRTFEY